MNANELLEHMQKGATLKKRYKQHQLKMVNLLTLPSGTVLRVQDSALKPLIRDGKLRSVLRQAGIRDYVLNDTTD